MDIDEPLKAGHCVEPAREMQLCADTTGATAARRVRKEIEGAILQDDGGRYTRSETDIPVVVDLGAAGVSISTVPSTVSRTLPT